MARGGPVPIRPLRSHQRIADQLPEPRRSHAAAVAARLVHRRRLLLVRWRRFRVGGWRQLGDDVQRLARLGGGQRRQHDLFRHGAGRVSSRSTDRLLVRVRAPDRRTKVSRAKESPTPPAR